MKWIVGGVSLAASLVTLYLARGAIADLWNDGYPALQFALLSATATGLAALLVLSRVRLPPGKLDADRQLLTELMQLLPTDGPTMRKVREWDFGAQFRWDWFEPLDRFVANWDGAERRFHHRRVERARSVLYHSAQTFLTHLAYASGPAAGEWSTVVPAEFRDTFGIDPELRHWADQVSEVHGLAADLFNAHQAFIREGRRALDT